MKKLPIGIQTFEKIIKENYTYVDKTKEAYNLINSYPHSFLSRPRKFGKSLFIDTLQNIFEGKKELFKGLYIYDKWEFEEYPVIKIDLNYDFSSLDKEEIRKTISIELMKYVDKLDLDIGDYRNNLHNPSILFDVLILATYRKYNKRVVILIDNWDKPIRDNILNEDLRDINYILTSMYIAVKSQSNYIKFAFATGVLPIKSSMLEGFNNFIDISLEEGFGDICGYTHENLKKEFKEYSKDFDLEKIKEWYNGYYFLKDEIYNPYDILKLFKNKEFKNYWWESGNNNLLITLLKENDYPLSKSENIITSDLANIFGIFSLRVEILLYQYGYLTIKDVKFYAKLNITNYKLGVPNKEVQISLNNLFYG